MTDFLQLFSTLREQMNATLSRSDVLKPLAWLVGILGTATLLAVAVKAPDWLLVTFAVFFGLAACLYIGAYVFCLINDRDSLRSETYSLQKMAIEHGMYGDSRMGLVDPSIANNARGTGLAIAAPLPTTKEQG